MPEPLLGVRSDDAGRTETIAPDHEPDLSALCAKVHARVTAFLDAQATTERLKNVQEQTRLSLKIIDEALDRYEYVARLRCETTIADVYIVTGSRRSLCLTMAARTVWSCSFSI